MIPHIVERFLKHRQWHIDRVFRDGPRYWVGRVTAPDRRNLVLKMVINNLAWVSWTGETLTPMHQLQSESLIFKTLMPEAVEADPAGAWLVRPFYPGRDMAAGPSPFIFKEEFFEPHNYQAVLDYIAHYQSLTPQVMAAMQSNPLANGHILQAKMTAIDYENPSVLLQPYAAAAHDFLNEMHDIHDRHSSTLAHGQMYPPHIIMYKGQAEVIDWESASLNNHLFDYAILWIRGFAHPDWQDRLLQELHDRGVFDAPDAQKLWDLEVLLGASGNLNYLQWSELESAEVKALAVPALKRNIESILGDA